jgi:hypothetical protein
MQLTLSDLAEVGFDLTLPPLDRLCDSIFRVYQHPVAHLQQMRRVVVLTERLWSPHIEMLRGSPGVHMSTDETCQLLWNLLLEDGRRIGTVAYDCLPESADYVLQQDEEGYRLAVPVQATPLFTRRASCSQAA